MHRIASETVNALCVALLGAVGPPDTLVTLLNRPRGPVAPNRSSWAILRVLNLFRVDRSLLFRKYTVFGIPDANAEVMRRVREGLLRR